MSGQHDAQLLLVKAGRHHRFDCECGRALDVEFSLPKPGEATIGLKAKWHEPPARWYAS